ncbi:MAG: multidrug resistance efflux transporter family protein [Marinifilaceae bacterium]|jgi:drug/metabolite transporter (DMT)-like permease|nr:multidrug resistance efflux transporter family protein [Marinifilaceae bacterium]
MNSNKSIAISLGVFSALFFAVTFVFNRLMSVNGGHWTWNASLRFFWMLPILLVIVLLRKKLGILFQEIKQNLWKWILWSTVGFGLFYAPLTYATVHGASWLVASTWQVTIIAGMLLAPIINNTSFKSCISAKTLIFSLIILLGIGIMQFSQAESMEIGKIIIGTIPVLISAIAYPLGNRKMMKITNGRLGAIERTLGMTICSIPFWILISCWGISENAIPHTDQIFDTLIVAICSGVIATVLFFMATDRVRHNQSSLASVEASLSTEVVFTLIGEILILKIHVPNIYSLLGIGLVILGMTLHSLKK